MVIDNTLNYKKSRIKEQKMTRNNEQNKRRGRRKKNWWKKRVFDRKLCRKDGWMRDDHFQATNSSSSEGCKLFSPKLYMVWRNKLGECSRQMGTAKPNKYNLYSDGGFFLKVKMKLCLKLTRLKYACYIQDRFLKCMGYSVFYKRGCSCFQEMRA